ncbi:hypothetical protein UCDDA912_g09453 [Diaporthe ampelina]|uniref:Uncharacterized protein n=1 Tax=Diaporthe ampelina TaxID=1214573 RepID=A0A0G2HQY8_9PEZI|nr:hypothetical protein UCDDA912_g09453 [Diaporthe ampelina]
MDTGGLSVGSALSQAEDVPALFEAIVQSMTEALRTSPNSTSYDGVGFNTVTYISISNRGVPAWKSSRFALLFHELEGWEKGELRMRGPEDVQRLVGNMAARVVDCDGVLIFERGRS